MGPGPAPRPWDSAGVEQVSTPLPPALGPAARLEMTARRLGPFRRFLRRRPVVVDVVVVLVFLVAAAPVRPPAGAAVPVTVTVLALACAALAVRRSRPLLTAGAIGVLTVAAVAATGGLTGFDLGIALAVYAVTVAHPPRVAWTTLGALVVVAVLSVWLLGSPEGVADVVVTTDGDAFTPPDERATGTTSVIITGLAAIAIGSSVRTRRQHLADLIARAEAVALDRDRQVQLARAAERSRIAREMHDVVAHSVTVMVALADGANASFDRSPERARTALAELSATGRGALADLRRVLGVLAEDDDRADASDEGVATAPTDEGDLTQIVDRFRTAGLSIRTTGLQTPLPDDTSLRMGLRRILTESLTNVLRHAPRATTTEVVLERATDPDRLVLTVTDSGATVPVQDAGGAGQGLVGMRERASLHGGHVTAGPYGTGWRVRAELPLQQDA